MSNIIQLARLSASQYRYKQAGQPAKGLGRVEKLLVPDPAPKPKPKPKPTGIPHVKIHVPSPDVSVPDLSLSVSRSGSTLPADYVPTPGSPATFGGGAAIRPAPAPAPAPTLAYRAGEKTRDLVDVLTRPVKNWQEATRHEMGVGPDQGIAENLLSFMGGRGRSLPPLKANASPRLVDYTAPVTAREYTKAFMWPELPKTMGGKAVPRILAGAGIYEGAVAPGINAYAEVKKVYDDPIQYFSVRAKKPGVLAPLAAASLAIGPERQRDFEARARVSFETLVKNSVKNYFGVGEPAKTMTDKAVYNGFREAVWDAGSYAAGQGVAKQRHKQKHHVGGYGDVSRIMRGTGPYLMGELGSQAARRGFEAYTKSEKPDFSGIVRHNLKEGYAPILTSVEGFKSPQNLKIVVEDYLKSETHRHLSYMGEAFEGMNPEEMIAEVGQHYGYPREQVVTAYRAAKIAAAAAAATEAARRGSNTSATVPSRTRLITGKNPAGQP